MMRAFGWLVLCLCLLAGVGYYLDWFNISTSINREKIKDDMDAVKDKIKGNSGEKAIE